MKSGVEVQAETQRLAEEEKRALVMIEQQYASFWRATLGWRYTRYLRWAVESLRTQQLALRWALGKED